MTTATHLEQNDSQSATTTAKVAVVIPCFDVAAHLRDVLAGIGPEVQSIYCVIDGCEQGSHDVALKAAKDDPRIQVLTHDSNRGVGATTVTGICRAIAEDADVIIKLDGDGQMDPKLIPYLARPVLLGLADYAKGNRFADLAHLRNMPRLRLIGNAGLSFFSKLSTGYWDLFDPTNGFVAIDAQFARRIPWEKVDKGYFFESDLLFHLYTLRARVMDRPMQAVYGEETSHLSPWRAALRFPLLHLRNFTKRLFYTYFLHNFNIASLNLVLGVALVTFGLLFGAFHWWNSIQNQQVASAGTVMLAALPFILGWQSLLAFFSFDMHNVPRSSTPFDEP